MSQFQRQWHTMAVISLAAGFLLGATAPLHAQTYVPTAICLIMRLRGPAPPAKKRQ